MKTIVLPYKPAVAYAILAGDKTADLRLKIPKEEPPYRVLIYVSKPSLDNPFTYGFDCQRIVGQFVIRSVDTYIMTLCNFEEKGHESIYRVLPNGERESILDSKDSFDWNHWNRWKFFGNPIYELRRRFGRGEKTVKCLRIEEPEVYDKSIKPEEIGLHSGMQSFVYLKEKEDG